MNYYLKQAVLALTGWIPDKQYLQLTYLMRMHEPLHLKNPRYMSEKIQWLKLYDYKPEYARMADKVAAREFVAERLGKDCLIKQYGVYERAEDILYDELPDRFVLKCSHDSASTIVVKNKKDLDRKNTNDFLNKRLKLRFYLEGRENVYKDVKPRIVCEEFLGDTNEVPEDYKVFCFGGKPEFIVVDVGRFKKHAQLYYDTNWNLFQMDSEYVPEPGLSVPKPALLKELLEGGRILSKGLRFIRVDFYIVNNKLYFGEMTFYPGAGFKRYTPESYDKRYASLINTSAT
ncbi:MAG: glycosyl transferase [Prevotella sp.]|nr:glycosyl transferase [Prevotella sp.]